ncbi:MAG TPA: hypothetical protein VLC30_13385 [Pseudomonas sp.]|nr:hypothetical protein [Pseudomonas sp.]
MSVLRPILAAHRSSFEFPVSLVNSIMNTMLWGRHAGQLAE